MTIESLVVLQLERESRNLKHAFRVTNDARLCHFASLGIVKLLDDCIRRTHIESKMMGKLCDPNMIRRAQTEQDIGLAEIVMLVVTANA